MARASFLSAPLWFRTLIFRFSALWIALLVAVILPPSREMLRFHILGSEIAPQLYNWGQPWDGYGDDFDPEPLLKKEPKNPALALWALQHDSEQSGNDDYYYGNYPSPSNVSSRQIFSLAKKFPNELWLKSLAIRTYIPEIAQQIELQSANGAPPNGAPVLGIPQKQKKAFKIPQDKYLLVQNCAKAEPDNAFWLVCEAIFRSSEFNFDAVGQLLLKASGCKVYDDKSLQAARELIQVQSRFRSLSWEEKKVIYEDANEESYFLQNLASTTESYRNLSFGRGPYPKKVLASKILMRIGALMQRGNNSIANYRQGMTLQNLAWQLAKTKTTGKTVLAWHLKFAAEMQKRGYPELAREALQIQHEQEAFRLWTKQPDSESWGYTPIYLNADGLATRANLARDGGMVLTTFFAYLVLWWSFLNVFLFRGRGAASTRRERIVPVAVFGTFFVVLSLVVTWWFNLVWNGTTPRSPNRDVIVITLAFFTFFGLPIVLAIFCALSTMRRFKADFMLPPRVDLELQITLFQRRLLRWLLPIGVICSVATLLFGWLLVVVAVLRDWGMIDLVGWLPPDRNGFTGNLSFHPINDPYLLVYGLIMCGVCLGVWFVKWRFFSPNALKPLTHGGLRRWKETIGVSVVATVGLYVFGSICFWPSRVELNRRMEQVLAQGPLSQMPSTPKSGPE